MTTVDSRFLKLKIVDDLSQGGSSDALSAEKGKELHERIEALEKNSNNKE